MKTKEKLLTEKEIINKIESHIKSIYDFYLTVDSSLVINEKRINLRNEEIKKVSLDYDASYYFNFFNAVAEYRERLKQDISNSDINTLLEVKNKRFIVESRIKNINSIFSKIYQYINTKKEKGNVSINKCINDLFGLRIIVPFQSIKKLLNIINDLSIKNNWKFKVINASKLEYKAVHMYLAKDNYSLPWEIQFWLIKDDACNRDSHARYKQAYTSWELSYSSKDLYRVIKK